MRLNLGHPVEPMASTTAAWPAVLLALGLALAGCVTVTSQTGVTSGPDSSPVTEPSVDATALPASMPAGQATTGAASPAGGPAVEGSPSAAGSATTASSSEAGPASADGTPATAPHPSRIGYISLDDGITFSRAVRDGVRDEALRAGLEVITCDSGWSSSGALACAERLASAGVGGIISFQPFADLTSQICQASGDVPLIGVVFEQGPCQVSLLEIDQAESGRLAGAAVGRFASDAWDCQANAFISLGSGDTDPAGRARMQGYRDGYRESCPMPVATIALDDADRVATARTLMGRLLETIRGDRVIVVGLNEDAILGAMSAASSAGRADDLWYSGQLADPSIRQHIACDDHYIASVAQFPERFGTLLVPTLVEAMAGGDVPARLEAPLQLVDADNVRELYPDTPTCDG